MPYQLKYKETLYSEKWIRQQYLEEGKSTVEIAKEIDCNRTAVNGALKKFGIVARGKISKYELLRDKEWLKEKYVDEQLTLRDIAKLSGSTVGNVHCHLETMGIKLRDPGVAYSISDKYKPRYGSDNNWWKGGTTISQDGRHLVLASDHPKKRSNNYITRARKVIEEHYGKYVEELSCQFKNCDKTDYRLEIHHKDKNKANDDITNLIVLCQYHHVGVVHNQGVEDYVEMVTQEQT